MKQALFDNVIDWENSTLPAKDTLSIDNFTFEYYGENVLTDNINGGVKQWAPIEGGTVTLLNYPRWVLLTASRSGFPLRQRRLSSFRGR